MPFEDRVDGHSGIYDVSTPLLDPSVAGQGLPDLACQLQQNSCKCDFSPKVILS